MPIGEGPADVIVTGGTIHSADDGCESPQAFAVRGGRFVYVGSAEGAAALRGAQTRVLDVTGKTVLPGLVDAHLHLTSLGLRLGQIDLRDAPSFEEVVSRTVTFAAATGDEWLVGRGWDQNDWPGAELPVHDALSRAFPDRPVVLTRIDGHALLANARAMQLASIDASTAQPPGGRIVRNASDKATGLFIDTAMALIEQFVPRPNHERLVGATRAAIAECNRWGVTAVAEPGCDDDTLAAHLALIARDGYSMRNHAMLNGAGDLLEHHFESGPVDASHDGRLSIRAVKLYADGALGSRGAALLEPYADDPANRGLIVTSPELMAEVTARALHAGFQPCIHAIGDRANRIVLDLYGACLRNRSTETRARIEHAQVVAPPDLPRFAALNVIASMQATHGLRDMAWARDRLGPQRMEGAYAWRRLLDTGAAVANGTDAPVEPVDTRRSFYAAVSGPSAPMTRREALRSMTIWAARANFQERFTGSIAPGKYADFVVMDRDWMTAPSSAILDTRILATYFAGEEVYTASAKSS